MFTDGRTDGQTDGRQAHRYIPRTFRSGDRNEKAESVAIDLICSLMLQHLSHHKAEL